MNSPRTAAARSVDVLCVAVAAILICSTHAYTDATADDQARSGGDLTVYDATSKAFGQHAPNLPVRRLREFTAGNRLFNTNWVTAPASVRSLDGLGPLFNRVSCSACHLRDGRGVAPSAPDEPLMSILLRLSVPGATPIGGPRPHPVYGGQLQDRAILGVEPEGRVSVSWETVNGHYPDGTPYTLRKPHIEVVDLAYGPLGENTMTSLRVAPAVFGGGLLEAISEETLLGFADPEDSDRDGISGRPNYVYDVHSGKSAIGRFGWKANAPNVRQQAAGAANGDVGITSSLFPKHELSAMHTAALEQPTGDDGDGFELSDMQLDRLTFYLRSLAVPARRNMDDPVVRKGEELFTSVSCAVCHVPELRTGVHAELPELSNQTIRPYSNLLLHDMGPDLADGRPDFLADGQEWRTPPLWGLGLVETVRLNGPRDPDQPEDMGLLHDGRAQTIEEAILWHGGEAESSRQAFMELSQDDRAALIAFLRSL